MLMIGKQLTAEQRLHKAVVAIMAHNKYHSVSPVMMIGKKSVCDKTRTAKTNGRDEVYGRAFVDSLTDPELRFLILHEVYHKMYRHLVTWRHLHKINARRANRACDYVINIKLTDYDAKEGFIVMPKCGLIDAQYRDMDSAQVFALLDDDEGGDEGGEGVALGGDPGERAPLFRMQNDSGMDRQGMCAFVICPIAAVELIDDAMADIDLFDSCPSAIGD